jgi:hypothetical protein
MKKLMFALPLCLLMACGGSASKEENAPKSEYFEKFKFTDDKGLEGSVAMGQTMDQVKKNHTGDELTDSDSEYLSFERRLGADADYDYASYYYSFDSETGKLTYSTIDIYPKDKKSAEVLYDDILNTFNTRFSKGKAMNSEGWVGTEWVANVGGVPTYISIERSTKEDYGWILVTFSEE